MVESGKEAGRASEKGGGRAAARARPTVAHVSYGKMPCVIL